MPATRRLLPVRRRRQVVTDANDVSLDGKDRDEWDRRWKAMPHRRLGSPPKIVLIDDLLRRFGDPDSFTVSEDPPRFCSRVGRNSECCPICGEPTSNTERLPASLHPRWANGLSVGFGVWVHRACFESCPDTGEPAPIPW